MMDDRHHRRASLLLTLLGAVGCSSSSSSSPVGTSTVVVPEPRGSVAAVPSGPPLVRTPPGNVSGWVKESNGTIHRASVTTCDSAIKGTACKGDERQAYCHTDADCKEGPHGRCLSNVGQIGTYCGCEYACESDSECKADEACACAQSDTQPPLTHSTCAPARCRTDADCPGRTCGLSVYNNGCHTEVGLACRQPGDACASHTDCATKDSPHSSMTCHAAGLADPGKPPHWECSGMTCAIGRPLVVDGEERTASRLQASRDWG